MANNENRPLSSDVIVADRAALVALKNLPDYAPTNPELRIDVLISLDDELRRAEEAEIVAANVLAAMRDTRIAAGWKLHNSMLGSKSSVTSQYGPNSDAVQSVGLKKKSDYKRPARRSTK